MRYLILLIALLFASPCHAGGDVYFGKYITPYLYNAENIQPQFYAGVGVDKTFFKIVTPSVSIETLMKQQNSDGSFAPMTVKYDIGLRVDVYDGFYVKGIRMCNHTVDYKGRTEQYWAMQVGYRWK